MTESGRGTEQVGGCSPAIVPGKARDAFVAALPEPEPIDSECPACRATPTHPCRDLPDGRFHSGRLDRSVRARERWLLGAAQAEDAEAILAANATMPTARRAKELTKPQRRALLVAAGWTPVDPRSVNCWRSPDPADRASWSLAAAMRQLLEAWPW